MKGIVWRRGTTTSAAAGCLTLLILAACGGEANPVRPNVTPTPTPGTWSVVGMYRVTVTAAPSCSLPDDAATRTYDGGLLRERGQDLEVLFDPFDGRFVTGTGPSGFGNASGFTGTRDGDAVRFTLSDDESAPYSFVYLMTEGTELAYSGAASGKMDGDRVLATLRGTVLIRHGQNHTVLARCEAADHRIEMALHPYPASER